VHQCRLPEVDVRDDQRSSVRSVFISQFNDKSTIPLMGEAVERNPIRIREAFLGGVFSNTCLGSPT
ncbi:MAG: hypothetical protein ACC700_19640, partial [Anaerolineales bacterium]